MNRLVKITALVALFLHVPSAAVSQQELNKNVENREKFVSRTSNSQCVQYSSDIFISELYDSYNNSYGIVEIYNNTGRSVDLSAYQIFRYGNIGDANPSANYFNDLSGTLPHGEVLIVKYGTSGTICYNVENNNNLLVHYGGNGFNENDEFKLVKNGVTIDNVHTPEEVGFTMQRSSSVTEPLAMYDTNQWSIVMYERGCTTCCDNLGVHEVISESTQIGNVAYTIGAVTCSDLGYIHFTSPLSDEYEYSINGVDFQQSPIFDDLNAGSYTTVVRTNNCSSDEAVVEVENLFLDLEFVLNGNNVICDDSSTLISIQDANFDIETAEIKWYFNGELLETTSSDLEASLQGEYLAVVTVSGCSTEASFVLQTSTLQTTVDSYCSDNSLVIQVNATSTTDVSYLWNTGDTSASIAVAEVGVYQVVVSTDSCTETLSYEITSLPCRIPRGISPNGDGKNDTFDLSAFGTIRNLQILNRYGMLVYEKDNYTNEWSGQSDNGKQLATGTYFYVVTFADGSQKTGWVYNNPEM